MILGNLCNFTYFEFLTSVWHYRNNKKKKNCFHFEEKQREEGKGRETSIRRVQETGLLSWPELAEKWHVSKKSQQLRNRTNIHGSVTFPAIPQPPDGKLGTRCWRPSSGSSSKEMWLAVIQDQKAGAGSPLGRKCWNVP